MFKKISTLENTHPFNLSVFRETFLSKLPFVCLPGLHQSFVRSFYHSELIADNREAPRKRKSGCAAWRIRGDKRACAVCGDLCNC